MGGATRQGVGSEKPKERAGGGEQRLDSHRTGNVKPLPLSSVSAGVSLCLLDLLAFFS